jgi:hypothetical protein
MIKCQVCTTENIDGSQYCDECGSALEKVQRNSGELEARSFNGQNIEKPVFQNASVTSLGIPSIIEELKGQSSEFESQNRETINGAHATLIIERGEAVGTEFLLSTEESYIGRWDADNGVFPDVDLDAYDTEAKVSRRHSRIIFANDRYSIEDLGSTNGTYVNRGRRLIPGNPHVLNDGDEVIVGKIFLRFNVNR